MPRSLAEGCDACDTDVRRRSNFSEFSSTLCGNHNDVTRGAQSRLAFPMARGSNEPRVRGSAMLRTNVSHRAPIRLIATLCLVALISGIDLYAQSTFGTLTGTVTDSSAAVV